MKKEAEPDPFAKLVDTAETPEQIQNRIDRSWSRSTHYHCPDCFVELKCIGPYSGGDGIRIGNCPCCQQLMVENRYGKPFWLKAPDKYKGFTK